MNGIINCDTVISYAQNAEDIVLLRALKDVKFGFYIDIGAADPVCDSVTKLFYDRGWHGINIEPSDEFFQRLCCERPRDINLCMAVSSREETKTIEIFSGTGLSTLETHIAKKHKKQGRESIQKSILSRRLDTILEEFKIKNSNIHFLKIDVEGHEHEVINSVDLLRYRPWIIVYEATEPNTNNLNDCCIPDILVSQGYRFCFFDGINKYFALSDLKKIQSNLYPANILDNYMPVGHSEVINRAIKLENDIEAKNNQIQVKEHELQHSMVSYNSIASILYTKDLELKDAALNYNLLLQDISELRCKWDELNKTSNDKLMEACDAYHLLQDEILEKNRLLKNADINYKLLSEEYKKLLAIVHSKDDELKLAALSYEKLMESFAEKDCLLIKANANFRSLSDEYQKAQDLVQAKDAELEHAALTYQRLMDFTSEKDKELQKATKAYGELIELVAEKERQLLSR